MIADGSAKAEKSEKYLRGLSSPERQIRLESLEKLVAYEKDKGVFRVEKTRDVNSHIHTIYSFSPYSPSAAVYHSVKAGLATTGIMDHDSVGGCLEFIEAGRICGMPVTVGAELRVSFAGTPLEGRKINNPDQETVAYAAFHGIPHSEIASAAEFFIPVSEARGKRNREMTDRINMIMSDTGIILDYDRDVLPMSMKHEGGSVTERHLLYALSCKLLNAVPKGQPVLDLLMRVLGMKITGRASEYLSDTKNPQYGYDLLNVLKSSMVEKFYIPATDECVPVLKAADFAARHGIVFAYAYLGDVTDSVTGDKKAQKFEDDYLDLLFDMIAQTGFNAVTYMPSRNTSEQLGRIRRLCDKYDLFQISGEDINQPRQKFVCEAMRSPEFSNLYDSAWALIGHEIQAGSSLENSMFSSQTKAAMPELSGRIISYRDKAMAAYGMKI